MKRKIDQPTGDGTEPIRFTIEPRDAKNGNHGPGSAGTCAAAIALCRLPNIKGVKVMRHMTHILFRDGRVLRYDNGAGLKNAVAVFDMTKGRILHTGDFDVLPPKETLAAVRQKNEHRDQRRRAGLTPKPSTKPGPRQDFASSMGIRFGA